jgi:hypothetical protein
MPGQSIFADEWRDCLKAHYLYVVREQDVRTERTLRGVMHNVGFSDDDLNELRVRTTMHVDDVGTAFVPDLEILKTIDETPVLEATDENVELQAEEAEAEEPVPYDESGPAQLSLF